MVGPGALPSVSSFGFVFRFGGFALLFTIWCIAAPQNNRKSSDKLTGEVMDDVDTDDFGSGSTGGLVSTAGGLWWAGGGCAIFSYDHDYGG